MNKYKILQYGVDYVFLNNINMKGSRPKKQVYDIKSNRRAIFKYENYECTEACSEKMSYEIAKLLGYKCAKIELARDENGVIGILNYLFTDTKNSEHIDAVSYINTENEDRKKFYTIENIENCLNKLDKKLFNDFLKIMVFDAFVGETDRHEENWGITIKEGKHKISPLYDNGCNLLRTFKNEKELEKYTERGNKNFNAFIHRSKTYIYNSENGKRYTHFELLEKLKENHEKELKKEIKKLEKISRKDIEKIVNKIPNELMTDLHKEYVIKYLVIRKEIMLKIIK